MDAVEDAARDFLGLAEFADGQGFGLCRIVADDHRAQAWRKCVRHAIERARKSRCKLSSRRIWKHLCTEAVAIVRLMNSTHKRLRMTPKAGHGSEDRPSPMQISVASAANYSRNPTHQHLESKA